MHGGAWQPWERKALKPYRPHFAGNREMATGGKAETLGTKGAEIVSPPYFAHPQFKLRGWPGGWAAGRAREKTALAFSAVNLPDFRPGTP